MEKGEPMNIVAQLIANGIKYITIPKLKTKDKAILEPKVFPKPIFGDIPLKDAMIAWNPKKYGGQIVVVPWSKQGGRYCDYWELDMTVGACYGEWREISHTKRLLWLFIEAWYITCRDGIDPIDMHKALSVIPEYMDTWNGESLFDGLIRKEL
jgi:hypothetical protein